METPQERFWVGEFGNEYARRNVGPQLLAGKLAMFSQALRRAHKIGSVRELGANIGLNIEALRLLLPDSAFQAVEINAEAFSVLKNIPDLYAVHGSLLEPLDAPKVDLTFTSGVLIHIDPGSLQKAYAHLYEGSRRYILICEYYNPTPVEVSYRGHADRLFKRDFAREIMETYADLKLVDYGFVYRGDSMFPGNDGTWFLMEKA